MPQLQEEQTMVRLELCLKIPVSPQSSHSSSRILFLWSTQAQKSLMRKSWSKKSYQLLGWIRFERWRLAAAWGREKPPFVNFMLRACGSEKMSIVRLTNCWKLKSARSNALNHANINFLSAQLRISLNNFNHKWLGFRGRICNFWQCCSLKQV